MSDELGATGKFPDGKANEDDEGEIQFGVGIHEGMVILDFGKSVKWLGMGPDDAIHVGSMLIEAGTKAKTDATGESAVGAADPTEEAGS